MRRVVTGRVVSDKMYKTITVCEDRLLKHPISPAVPISDRRPSDHHAAQPV